MEQTTAKKHVVIFTQGACPSNPGPGGWSCILKFGEHRKELSGFMQETTDHRMALFAAISGLGALKESCRVTLYSASPYVVDAFEKRLPEAWKRAGWKNEKNMPIPDTDLWFILMAQIRKHDVRFVRAGQESASPESIRCKELAMSAIEEWRSINSPHDTDGELIAEGPSQKNPPKQ
jgi:ribonuclease HI